MFWIFQFDQDKEAIGITQKICVGLLYVARAFAYIMIIEFISNKKEDLHTNIIRAGAFIAIGTTQCLAIANEFDIMKSIPVLETIYSRTELIFKLLLFALLAKQVYDEEKGKPEKSPVIEEDLPIITDTRPKFRNPALEEQEARLAAERERWDKKNKRNSENYSFFL